ncbi:hypothetical protein ACWDKQ_02815 [Saccharopolyspora sp. NPDC000995]
MYAALYRFQKNLVQVRESARNAESMRSTARSSSVESSEAAKVQAGTEHTRSVPVFPTARPPHEVDRPPGLAEQGPLRAGALEGVQHVQQPVLGQGQPRGRAAAG